MRSIVLTTFPCNHRSCCQIGSAGKISSFKHPRTTKMRHIAYQYIVQSSIGRRMYFPFMEKKSRYMKWRPMTSPSSTYVLHILSFHAIGTLTLHWCGRNILLYIYWTAHWQKSCETSSLFLLVLCVCSLGCKKGDLAFPFHKQLLLKEVGHLLYDGTVVWPKDKRFG